VLNMSMFSIGRAAAYLRVNVTALHTGTEGAFQAGALSDCTPSLCMTKNHALAGSALAAVFPKFLASYTIRLRSQRRSCRTVLRPRPVRSVAKRKAEH
jgi:hypothetical protein